MSYGNGSDGEVTGYTYAPNNGKLTSVSYGNGFTVSYTYDNDDRVTETVLELGDVIYSYIPVYDTDGEVTSYTYRKYTENNYNGEKLFIALTKNA